MAMLKHCLLRMVTNDSNKIVWPHFGWQKQLVCCSMAASCSFSSGTSTGGNARKSRGGGSPRPKASSSSPLPHKYILAMFPYPSGRLHMGHLRVYALSDVLSRYYALKGHPVLHPIGWDAFGLPAENAARERGVDPAEWTQRNIEEMRAQLLRTGVRFNWDRELSTCHPDYFRWTQWLFLQLHSHGFVRKAWADVNWDPVDGTVLAEEQVSHDGRSWRSNALVERRRLRQWVVDTPRYAKRLLDGLAPLEFEWHEIARIQSDWIGPCDVFRFLLPVQQSSFASAASFPQQQPQTPQRPLQQTNLAQEGQWHAEQLDLRIADPAQLGAAQFVLLTRHHQIAQQARRQGGTLPDDAAGRGGGEEDFAILPDRWVSNFVTGRPMPLVVLLRERADEEPEEMEAVEMGENATGNATASAASSPPMPAFLMDCRLGHRHSGRPLDRAIADRLALPDSTNSTSSTNSKQPTAGDGQRRGRRMTAVEVLRLAELLGLGGYQTSRKLRDWVVSRQRGWGTPIPMLLEEQSPEGEGGIGGGGGGGAVSPVHDEQLPILGEQRGQRMVNVPGCRFASGRLETDTLDTYFDSSWYFLRFLDPHNRDHACDPAIAQRQMPVNVYVGGVEHAQMHMFYARFISHFLYSYLGLLPQPEPFARFIALGMVRSRAYRVLSSGKYVPPSEVDGDTSSPNSFLIHRPTGQQVQVQFEKMSKSKHNGVDPIEMIDQYGADLTRLQLLFAARPNMNIDWPYPQPTYQIKNLRRWLSQVDSLVNNYVAIRSNSQEATTTAATDGDEPPTALPNGQQQQQQPSLLESTLRDIYNRHVKGVSMYLEVLRYHNTALIRLIDMTRALDKAWPTAAASTTTATASGGRQLQQQKQPIRHRGSAAELERCVHALVIMMQVFAPATAAEHWAKLQTLPAAHLQQSRPWWRPGAPLDGQRWPQLDPGDMVDFVLVTFGTIFSQQAPRADVEHLSDQQLERYARQRTHARFFQRLEERQLRVQSSSVERLPGLCLVLRIKMAEDVRKRAITEIIQRYSKGSSKGSSSNDSADDGDDGIEDNNKMPRRRKKKAKKDGQQELGKEKEKAMRMEGKEDENDENDDHGWEGKSSRSKRTSRKSRSEQG